MIIDIIALKNIFYFDGVVNLRHENAHILKLDLQQFMVEDQIEICKQLQILWYRLMRRLLVCS